MREVFTRVEDGNIINIEVNLDIEDFKDTNPWLLSVFIKHDIKDNDSKKYEEFLETKEALVIALQHQDRAKYVGSRIVDGWSELYFYSYDSKRLDIIVKKILSVSSYLYESHIVRDTKWNFYDTNLFPTELESCHIQSAKIIFLLEEEGDDLEQSREVEHYISFETPTQKNRFINTLDIDGFSFKDDISTEEFEHAIALVKEHKITKDEVDTIVEELFLKIQESAGYYEGWSTTLLDSKEL